MKTIAFLISSDLPREGKDTAARAIYDLVSESYFNIQCQCISLAYEVKKEVCKKNNLNFKRMMSDDKYKCENRYFLIKEGQEQRKIEPTVWCRKMVENLTIDNDKELSIFLIPDLRFKNELEYLKKSFDRTYHIHITASKEAMASRIGIDHFSKWFELITDESERELILGTTINPLLNDEIVPDLIISNNASETIFKNMIMVFAEHIIDSNLCLKQVQSLLNEISR